MRRINWDDVADDEPVEKHFDGGEVLLQCWRGMFLRELLDVAGHVNRLHALKRQLVLLASVRKPRDRDQVRLAGIPVADVGREKFPKAFAGVGRAQERAARWQGVGNRIGARFDMEC